MKKHHSSREEPSPHILALADRLITNIRQRGLAVGDRYLTTDEVSRMLGVRKSVAVAAMRHLSLRDILISRQRSGTFIGPAWGEYLRSKVQTVHVLMQSGEPLVHQWLYQPFVEGIRQAIPEANVQFSFIPDNNPLPYLQELIDGSRTSGQLLGIVAVSCPSAVYRYLAEQRMPAVVYGSVHPSDMPINSVDADNYQSGRLLTQYLIDRGHRRMALIKTSAGLPGTNLFLDGVSDALSEAGLPPNALFLRVIRTDFDTFRAIAKELLQQSNRPKAIVTQGSVQAHIIASVASDLGLAIPDDLDLAFEHECQTAPSDNSLPYPQVRYTLSYTETAAKIGVILKELSNGMVQPPRHIVIPVEFYHP
jgi:DNA-binding LacI/PurR family transcriptional regulator